ncbi:Uncharacterised protein [Vibrio cholerae]|nr:Uncharacterised protein [Vibrio cholerae]
MKRSTVILRYISGLLLKHDNSGLRCGNFAM